MASRYTAWIPATERLDMLNLALGSNLDYRGEASTSLASTLRTLVVATQQSNTAIVLAQAIRARGTVLQVEGHPFGP